MPLSADQKAMLQLLLERGQSYDDLASILGTDPAEVRARARAALRELAGTDPDRNVALTDYLLGQADPIDRADVVRHLKDDPRDLELVTELAQKLRLVAPEAELPRLPGEERAPRPRRATRERLPAPLRKLTPPRRGPAAEGDEARARRTTLTRRQTQGIVVLGCAAVLVAVGALAIAGVFTGDNADSATTTTTTSANVAGNPPGFPLGVVKPSKSGSYQQTIPIPPAVQSLLSQVQAVAITLASDQKVARSIQVAVRNQQQLEVQGTPAFLGVLGPRQGKVFPIKLQAGKGIEGSGNAALGVENKQPFFQVKLSGLRQPPKGQSYILWLVLGSPPSAGSTQGQ
jgi:anti-sigma factor RsiW